MEWLNYHHLLYFWLTAKTGSVTKASDELRLSQSTVSAQIRALERALDEKLFRRHGRRLVRRTWGRSSSSTPRRSSRSGASSSTR